MSVYHESPLAQPGDGRSLLQRLTQRYGNVDSQALESILCPSLIPIQRLDKTIIKMPGQSHYRATFAIQMTSANSQLMLPGRTGKFVPETYISGGPWREICEGRVLEVDARTGVATGEVYVGSSSRSELALALEQLSQSDFLEVDQFGSSAKVLSGLVEYSLYKLGIDSGYNVRRMPEDVARHISDYFNYDFEFEKNNVVRKVESKSIWGTNTKYARLIHSKGRDYPTSSCKFATQDIFAVSLFLRTGNISDFAFARSVPRDVRPYGLPRAAAFPEHVHQNPLCQIGDGTWFATVDEVWDLP